MFRFKLLQRALLNPVTQRLRCLHTMPSGIIVSEEVNHAINSTGAVVALESALITHGLPYPENLKCALNLEKIVRRNSAVPATIGILDGIIHIGMDSEKIERLATLKENVVKVSRRDLPYVIANRLHGGTTVATTMMFAYKAGIPIFATGGIGGVHRGAETTMDVSADLYELSRTPITVVSAGVKSILDIGLTLEYLETLGVCVVTYGSSKIFPSFFTQNSGFSSSCNVEGSIRAASLIYSRNTLQLQSGILLAAPIPDKYIEDGEQAQSVIETALQEAKEKNITGKNITPFVLERVRTLSKGASLRANIGLLENNACIASEIAVDLSEFSCRTGISSPRTLLSPIKHEASDVISRPKPVVIGGSILDIHVKMLEDIKMDGRTIAGEVQSTAGGVGRNVADCMTRLGASPLFISLLGAQEYAKSLMSKMSHMDNRGIKILPDARTATCLIVIDSKGECPFIVGDLSIHDQLLPKELEVHEDMITSAPLIVIDANMPLSTMNYIMNLSTKHQVPVWFEPTDVSKAFKAFKDSAWRSSIAYASPNLNELKVMHDTIFGKVTPPLKADCLERKIEESLRLGVPLLNDALHTLIVTLASHGILIITTLSTAYSFPMGKTSPDMGKVQAFHYPAPNPGEIVSVSGAGDCFAAGVISATLRGLHRDASVYVGQEAAILSLSSHHAVPHYMQFNEVFDGCSSYEIPTSVL